MNALTEQLICDDSLSCALSVPSPRLEHGVIVYKYELGFAAGCFELRNRGRQLLVEVTCWPKEKGHVRTTGATTNQLHDLKLKGEQVRIAAILDKRPHEVAEWVERWRARARFLAVRRVRFLLRQEKQLT